MQIDQDPDRLLATFLDTTLQLTGDLEIENVLLAVVESAMDLTGAAYGAGVTLGPDGAIEHFEYRGLTPDEVALLPHIPEGKGLLGEVLKQRTTIRLERLQDHPSSVGFPDDHVPMHAFLGVPLQKSDNLVGALYLTKRPEQEPFTEADQTFFETMAAIATVGITNARLYSAEKSRAERGSLMGEISAQVRRSLDVDEVLTATVETLARAASVDRCFIHLVEDGDLGQIRAEWTAPGMAPLKGREDGDFPVSDMAASTGATQWSDDVMEDARFSDPDRAQRPIQHVERGTRAVLAAPLAWGDDVLGVVAFHTRRPRRWTDGDVALIEAAGREVSIALNHARRFAEAVETAARLRALDEMRSDFVTMVSHELRSPMTVVAGIADILKKRQSALSSEQRDELIDTLGREARRLTRLVSEVLDLEALDQGSMELHLGQVDLASLAQEAVTDAGAAERTDIAVGRGNSTCTADSDRIKQVLLNLISNAVKFSGEDRPIKVTVSPEKDSVCISVKDNGPGIALKDQEKLFHRFARLETGAVRKPGSGLGLYLSKSIIDAHDGEIWIDSSPRKGATFSIRLKRKPA